MEPWEVSAVHRVLANVELEAVAERFFQDLGRTKTDLSPVALVIVESES